MPRRLAPPRLNLQNLEREHILDALKQTGRRIRGQHGAAAALGLKATTLEYRMTKLGLRRSGIPKP